MSTEKLWISSSVRRHGDADEILREYAEKNGITGKDYLHLSLLTEETLGLAARLPEDFEGELRLERTAGGCNIVLEAAVGENNGEKQAPAASPEGFMAKIAEMMNCSYMFGSISEMPDDLAGMLPDYMSYGMREGEGSPVWAGRWSLSVYRRYLRERMKEHPEAEPVLDELEKSIVAQLADEVTVGIHGRKIRLVITKNLRENMTAD